MSNFIGLVYATLKNEGIDTSGMDTDEAIKKYNELQEKTGGKSGEKEGTPAENRKLEEKGIKEKVDYKEFAEKKLPSGKDYDSIEIGKVNFEKYSKASLLEIIKDYKSGVSQMTRDETIFIEYKDGTTKYIESEEDIGKLTNIKSIIWSNENGYGFTGDVEIVNYNEIFDDWGGDDYRVELKSDIPSLMKQSEKDNQNN